MILDVLSPQNGELEGWQKASLLTPFCDEIITFLHAFSDRLLGEQQYKAFPELVALGFWLRERHIRSFYEQLNGLHKPLGQVVHFAPANVDTMFVYSWVCSLLMGNKNIVRLSSKDSALKQTLISVLNSVLAVKAFRHIAAANLFVSFSHHSEWSQKLSAIADARVIWGGDDSVQQIRAYPIPPTCRDITFADKYSAAIVNGNQLKSHADTVSLAEHLWRDTKPYMQQACSSPRVIFWLGDQSQQIPLLNSLNERAKDFQALNQLNQHVVTGQWLRAQCSQANVLIESAICAVSVSRLSRAYLDMHMGGGLFYIRHIDDIEQIASELDSKCQTLCYAGIEKGALIKVLANPSITGVDRVVPVGQALDFETTWDGISLIHALSRQIVVR
ncbi:acyl-CoA reductase [Aestuariibacter salexigens]|uniref:acyl-CoA reductase n=1 Tax=Aestuariibacter salexigens TaxID=226010 RepID=UPI00041DE594|nr:acyl-CoA reductase [Aestuariibacter salexigens]